MAWGSVGGIVFYIMIYIMTFYIMILHQFLLDENFSEFYFPCFQLWHYVGVKALKIKLRFFPGEIFSEFYVLHFCFWHWVRGKTRKMNLGRKFNNFFSWWWNGNFFQVLFSVFLASTWGGATRWKMKLGINFDLEKMVKIRSLFSVFSTQTNVEVENTDNYIWRNFSVISEISLFSTWIKTRFSII